MVFKLSLQSAGLLLLGLTAALWVLVLAQFYGSGTLDLFAIATALAFTGLVIAWPFLEGLRLGRQGVQHVRTCHSCGGRWDVLAFCIHCGAFPKARPGTA